VPPHDGGTIDFLNAKQGPASGAEGDLTQEPIETADSPQAERQQESVGESFTRLYADGRAYARAEMQRQKLRAGLIGTGVRDALILGITAFLLLFAALVALLVGFVLALTPSLGPIGASFAILGGTLLVVIVLLLLAKGRITRMTKAIK